MSLRDGFKKGERVEFRPSYGSMSYDKRRQRGTVVSDAPMSLVTGVEVLWDDGEKRVVPCLEARHLNVLELMAEVDR